VLDDGHVIDPRTLLGQSRRRSVRPGADAAASEGLEQFESRLVWIFGSPRSGSTWLLELLIHPLALHGDWTGDDVGLDQRRSAEGATPEAVPINEPYIPQHLTPPLFEDQSGSGDFIAATLNSFRHGQPDYFLSDRYAETWRPRLRALVLDRLRVQADEISASYALRDPLVVIKEPNGSTGADFVMSLVPRARMIFLLRDGRDVVDSMVDAQQPGGWLERTWDDTAATERGRLEIVRRESMLWLGRTQSVQRAYDEHPASLRHLVRYEDLRADPHRVLAELDSWLGLGRDDGARAEAIRSRDFDSVPDDVRGPGKQLRAAQPGLWRSSRSAAEQQVMAEVMGATLSALGYP
jgi:Sulfotransferase family